jgi:hypothetical protein
LRPVRDVGDVFLEGGDGLAVGVAHGDEYQRLEGQA